jgi:hypothetical protein
MVKLAGPAAVVVGAGAAGPRDAPLAGARVAALAGDPEARPTEHEPVASSSNPTRNAIAALASLPERPRPCLMSGFRAVSARAGTRAMLLHLLKLRGASGVAPSGQLTG